MKGIVIHHQGKIWRALQGRNSVGRFAILAIAPVPLKQAGTSRGGAVRRPVHFVFSVGARSLATSQNVTFRNGRRYPEVEHWFMMPESRQHFGPQRVATDFSSAGVSVNLASRNVDANGVSKGGAGISTQLSIPTTNLNGI